MATAVKPLISSALIVEHLDKVNVISHGFTCNNPGRCFNCPFVVKNTRCGLMPDYNPSIKLTLTQLKATHPELFI